MSRFQGISLTTLSATASQAEIQTQVRKALFDLLKNDNTIYSELFPVSGSADGRGNYIKYPDGTMIAWVLLTAGTATQTWTFPIPFMSNPIVTTTAANNAATIATNTNTTTTTIDTQCWTVAGAGSTVNRRSIAIGQWK